VLGNAIPNILTTKQRRRQQQKLQHTCGPNAITIKITVMEYDRISAPELFAIAIDEFSSKKKTHNARYEAALHLTALIFQDDLRRLYNVYSATI